MSLAALPGFAQQTGRIVGFVTDAYSGDSLAQANVIISGTNIGATTDSRGFYSIDQVPKGVYALKASHLGHERDSVASVEIKTAEVNTVNFKIYPCGTSQAREDLANGKVQLFVLGLTVRVLPEEVENRLSQTYGFLYNRDHNLGPCSTGYNEAVFDYLNRLNAKGWYDRFQLQRDSLIQVYAPKAR